MLIIVHYYFHHLESRSNAILFICSHGFAAVELDYDRYGRLIEWKRGDLKETYEYDRSGRLLKIHYSDGTSLANTLKDTVTHLVSLCINSILF